MMPLPTIPTLYRHVLARYGKHCEENKVQVAGDDDPLGTFGVFFDAELARNPIASMGWGPDGERVAYLADRTMVVLAPAAAATTRMAGGIHCVTTGGGGPNQEDRSVVRVTGR
jgi:hypothetical protein